MSGPRTSWPAAGLAPGYDDPNVIEAHGSLESVASGVQGNPASGSPWRSRASRKPSCGHGTPSTGHP